jgi:hypothetical protein
MRQKYKSLTEVIETLPRHSYSIHGKPMEPITIILLGGRNDIIEAFHKSGWYLAVPITFLSSIKSGLATIFNASYRTGPMWPSYIGSKRHQMGFERPTAANSYRRRHHLRLWKTSHKLDGKRVWVGTLSYDRSVGRFRGSLLPTHHICSKLSSEENFLARTFRIAKPEYIKLSNQEIGHINTGDPYIWDGKALVIDCQPR